MGPASGSLLRSTQEACSTPLKELPRQYSTVPRDHLPWLCADISYQYALLVDGLGVTKNEKVHLLRDVGYRGSRYSAKWPLGDALFALMDANFTNTLPPSPPLPPPAWTGAEYDTKWRPIDHLTKETVKPWYNQIPSPPMFLESPPPP